MEASVVQPIKRTAPARPETFERVRSPGAIPEALLSLPGRLDVVGAELRWPAWKVTLFVLSFCGAFWGAVGYAVATIAG